MTKKVQSVLPPGYSTKTQPWKIEQLKFIHSNYSLSKYVRKIILKGQVQTRGIHSFSIPSFTRQCSGSSPQAITQNQWRFRLIPKSFCSKLPFVNLRVWIASTSELLSAITPGLGPMGYLNTFWLSKHATCACFAEDFKVQSSYRRITFEFKFQTKNS